MKKVFIASSEGTNQIAHAVQSILEKKFEVIVWDQSFFTPTHFTLEVLTNRAKEFDYAIFVFSPEDKVEKSGKIIMAVRDNVLFELGLFMGTLSRERCFIIVPYKYKILDLPSDLHGLNLVTYDSDRENIEASLGPACSRILNATDEIDENVNLSVEYLPERGKLTSLYIESTKNATTIDIIALSLSCFVDNYKQRDIFNWLTQDSKTFRILVLNPESCAANLRSIEESKNLKQKILNTFEDFKNRHFNQFVKYAKNIKGSFEIRTYNKIPYFSYFKADEQIVYGFNYPIFSGQMSDCLYLKKDNAGCHLYSNLVTTFEALWDDADSLGICRITPKDVFMEYQIVEIDDITTQNCKTPIKYRKK